jgi:hypothetical protein
MTFREWIRENKFWLSFSIAVLLWYYLTPESWRFVGIWIFGTIAGVTFVDKFADDVAERVVKKLGKASGDEQ